MYVHICATARSGDDAHECRRVGALDLLHAAFRLVLLVFLVVHAATRLRPRLSGAVALPRVEHNFLDVAQAEAALARLVEHQAAVRARKVSQIAWSLVLRRKGNSHGVERHRGVPRERHEVRAVRRHPVRDGRLRGWVPRAAADALFRILKKWRVRVSLL